MPEQPNWPHHLGSDVPGDHTQAEQGPQRFAQQSPAADVDDLQVWDTHHQASCDGDWADTGPDQASDPEDLIDLSWTEHVLHHDGTWQHTKTVTQQVPAADIHAWSDHDDTGDGTADDWPYGDGLDLDLGDEL